MLNHKKFIDIQRFQTKYADCFEKGDIISVQEKLDGSCSSIEYDSEDNKLMCFSRRKILSPTETLMGFYEYVQKLDMEIFKKYSTYRLFGEWNLSHLVKYAQEEIKKFHCFDIYDTVNKVWLPQDIVKAICKEGNIQMVPVFYEGEFISWDHIQEFIGKTQFGLNNGEGIILKNQTKLNNPNERMPFVVKLVATEFQEVMKSKVREPLSADEIARREYLSDLTASIVTENRVEKNLYKMIAENVLPEDWDETSMSLIAKELPRIIYHDCVKEENEIVEKIEGFGKLCASHTMQIVRKILQNR